MTLLFWAGLYFVVYIALWLLANMLPILGTIIKGLLLIASFIFWFFWFIALILTVFG